MSKVPSGGIGAVLALLRIAVDMLTEMHGQCECIGCGAVYRVEDKQKHIQQCTNLMCVGCGQFFHNLAINAHIEVCEKHPMHQAITKAVAAERERVEGEFDRWREE